MPKPKLYVQQYNFLNELQVTEQVNIVIGHNSKTLLSKTQFIFVFLLFGKD